MSTDSGPAHAGYQHESGFFGSDEELLAIVVPFLRSGVAAGEPTMVALSERNAAIVRRSLGDTTGITFLRGEDQYRRPALTIRAYRDVVAKHVAAGATRVRAVGEVPHSGGQAHWEQWARYEAAINDAYEELPLWGVCCYDTRVTPDDVLHDVMHTHPHIATPDGLHIPNHDFTDPAAFITQRPPAPADPIESTTPAVMLVDPTPAASRRAVQQLGAATDLAPDTVQDLITAVSEAVANAMMHGRPPVVLRAWRARDRVVVTVNDRGEGPPDPFAGLLPATQFTADGGLGLWIAHQLCAQVTLSSSDEGFMIRLVAIEDAPASTGAFSPA
jgi:anti-sigma regulatory factor (Ser/Thr protein kinase)